MTVGEVIDELSKQSRDRKCVVNVSGNEEIQKAIEEARFDFSTQPILDVKHELKEAVIYI